MNPWTCFEGIKRVTLIKEMGWVTVRIDPGCFFASLFLVLCSGEGGKRLRVNENKMCVSKSV